MARVAWKYITIICRFECAPKIISRPGDPTSSVNNNAGRALGKYVRQRERERERKECKIPSNFFPETASHLQSSRTALWRNECPYITFCEETTSFGSIRPPRRIRRASIHECCFRRIINQPRKTETRSQRKHHPLAVTLPLAPCRFSTTPSAR